MDTTPANLPTRLPVRPRSLSGWPLRLACDLDIACPNFMTHVAFASDAKRQAIFAAIAAMVTGGSDGLKHRLAAATGIVSPDPHAQIARALVTLKAREVLRAVFRDVPDGLLGIVGRLGPDPVKRPTLYGDMFVTFAEPRHRARAKLLRQSFRMVTEDRVEIALRLDPLLCHQPIYDGIKLLDEVEGLHAALALIRATVTNATDEDLRRSIIQITAETSTADWIVGWLRRQDRLLADPPIHNDPDLILITTPELAAAGREMHNCLGEKVLRSAVGRNTYYRWLPKPGGVVELTRLSDGRWFATEVRRPYNVAPDPITAAAISRKLHEHGVATVDWPFPTSQTRAVAELVNAFDMTADWSGIEGVEDNLDRAFADRVAA